MCHSRSKSIVTYCTGVLRYICKYSTIDNWFGVDYIGWGTGWIYVWNCQCRLLVLISQNKLNVLVSLGRWHPS
jgi:hypothetical protein